MPSLKEFILFFPNAAFPYEAKNVWLEVCIQHLRNNGKSQRQFQEVCNNLAVDLSFYPSSHNMFLFNDDYVTVDHIIIITILLARTTKGEAVIPFLDVKTDVKKMYYIVSNVLAYSKPLPNGLYHSFNNLLTTLSLTFFWLISNGVSKEEAINKITQIYVVATNN